MNSVTYRNIKELYSAFIMATASDTLFNTGNNPIAFSVYGKQSLNYVPDPPSKVESKIQALKDQMLAPFVVANRLFSFHEPYQAQETHPKTVNQYFPYFLPATLSAFNHTQPIDNRFMVYDIAIFTSIPTLSNIAYLAWLDRIQEQLKSQWEKLGIFKVIQISWSTHTIDPKFILSSIFF